MTSESGDQAPVSDTPFDLVVRGEQTLTTAGIVAREIGIRDGRVVAIEPLGSGLVGAEVIELADDQVMIPGLVDTHVHVNEPGRTEWEGFDSATRAAAAGGVTTLIDMPLNSIPPTVNVDALAEKRAAAQGKNLRLQLGYSHDVNLDIPEGLTVATPDQTTVQISGSDKQKVGQVAAEIRRWRKPEPYKGKGIKDAGEFIFRKEGKKK